MKKILDKILKTDIITVKFIRFAAVGCLNTLISYAVYCILLYLNCSWVIASPLSYVAGMLNSFVMNKKWTFQDKGEITARQISFFILCNFFIWLISYIILSIAVIFLNYSAYIGQLLAIVFSLMANYLGNRWLFFGTTSEKAVKKVFYLCWELFLIGIAVFFISAFNEVKPMKDTLDLSISPTRFWGYRSCPDFYKIDSKKKITLSAELTNSDDKQTAHCCIGWLVFDKDFNMLESAVFDRVDNSEAQIFLPATKGDREIFVIPHQSSVWKKNLRLLCKRDNSKSSNEIYSLDAANSIIDVQKFTENSLRVKLQKPLSREMLYGEKVHLSASGKILVFNQSFQIPPGETRRIEQTIEKVSTEKHFSSGQWPPGAVYAKATICNFPSKLKVLIKNFDLRVIK